MALTGSMGSGTRRVHVEVSVLFDMRADGNIATLRLTVRPDGPPGLYPDPAVMPFLVSDGEFREAVGNAWNTVPDLTSRCVTWAIVKDGVPCIDVLHGSLGAAFAVALTEVARKLAFNEAVSGPTHWHSIPRALRLKRLDGRWAVSAAIHANGKLRAVTGYKWKLKAAASQGGVRVLLAAASKGEVDTLAERRGVRVSYARDLREAVRVTSRLLNRTLVVSMVTIAVIVAGGAVALYAQHVGAVQEQQVADSRRLVQRAESLRTSQPGLARQLLVAAYRISPTSEATDALMNSLSMPAVLPIRGFRTVVQHPQMPIIAIATDKGTVLTDTRTGETIARMPSHDGYVGALAFSPNGKTLATGTSGGTVTLWDVRDPSAPKVRYVVIHAAGIVDSLAFSPNGRTLAVAIDGQTVFMIHVRSRTRPTLLNVFNGFDSAGLYAPVVFSADGDTLITGGPNSTIRLWDVTDPTNPVRRPSLHVHSGDVAALAFSPSTNTLAAAGDNDIVSLWDLADPDHPGSRPPLSGHTGFITSLAFSPDGRMLASGSANQTVRLWNLTDPLNPVAEASKIGHTDIVYAVSFSPDGRTLLSGSSDDTVRLWRTDSSDATVPLSTLSADPALAYAPRGNALATTDPLRLWDLADPTAPRSTTAQLAMPQAIGLTTTPAYSPNGRILAAGGADGVLRLFRVTALGQASVLSTTYVDNKARPDVVIYAPNGKTLATSDEDGAVRLWDVRHPAHPHAFPPFYTTKRSSPAIAFSPDAGVIGIADSNGTFQLWDAHDPSRPKRLSSMRLPGKRAATALHFLAFSPDHHTAATATSANTTVLWDVSNPTDPRPVDTLSEQPHGVEALAFSHNGRLLASAGEKTNIHLWNTSDPTHVSELATLDGTSADTLAFGPGGGTLASGTMDDATVRIWDTSIEDLIARACWLSAPAIDRRQWQTQVPNRPYDPPCAGVRARPTIPLRSPDTTAKPSRSSSPSSHKTSAPDIHQVDWSAAAVPGGFCDIQGSVRLKHGSTKAESTTSGKVGVHLLDETVYGDLDGDGRPEAGIGIDCDNRGGTADGVIAYAYLIFSNKHDTLALVGTIIPQRQLGDVLPTLIQKVTIAPGKVLIHEAWYRPADPTCCPSGTAITRWTYRDRQLSPGTPNITG